MLAAPSRAPRPARWTSLTQEVLAPDDQIAPARPRFAQDRD
jgi:hypothetical protein